jgi:hypothetical protein
MMSRHSLAGVLCASVLTALQGQAYGSDPNYWKWTTLNYPGAIDTWADGISGNIIWGQAHIPAPNSPYWDGIPVYFLYDGTTYTTLPHGVSDIEGNKMVGGGWYYDGSTWTTLNYPGTSGQTYATGISGNNIVGFYGAYEEWHGFLYDGSTWTTLDYSYEGITPPPSTCPEGISGNTIVGVYRGLDTDQAFLYSGGTWTTLVYPGSPDPFMGSYSGATDIDGGNIVGYYHTFAGGTHGFLYDGTNWTTLPYCPGMRYTEPWGISGDTIVGYCLDATFHHHGFILTIPEPATLSILALGGLTLLRRRQWTTHRSGGER